MARRIGILPGTFDPIHLGHVELAREAKRVGGLDEVWLLVDAQPIYKTNALSYQQRFDMASLGAADEGWLKVNAPELESQVLPHTMAGFEQLLQRYPEEVFEFIVGADMMDRLDTWEDYERVVKAAVFLVAGRSGVPADVVERLRQRLGSGGERLRVQLLDFERHGEASSSLARERLKAGERPAWLDSRVYEYIRAHQLYS